MAREPLIVPHLWGVFPHRDTLVIELPPLGLIEAHRRVADAGRRAPFGCDISRFRDRVRNGWRGCRAQTRNALRNACLGRCGGRVNRIQMLLEFRLE